MKAFIILFVMIGSGYSVQSQNPASDTLQWSLGQGTDLRTNQSFVYTGSLITNAQSVQWVQKSLTSTFSVTSVSGSWSDVSQQGQLVFTVEEEGASGLLTIERTSNGLYVTMEFPRNDPQGSKVKWAVTQVTNNN